MNIFELEKGPTKLTSHDDDTSYQPRFSPTGKALLFTRFNPEKSDNDLYILDDFLKPKSVRRLTKQKGAELNASWSPDGSKVAYYNVYVRGKKTKTDLWIINADGTDKKLLHEDVVRPDLSNPVWSADGNLILFVRDDPGGHNPLAIASVDNPQRVADIPTDTVDNGDLAGFWAANGSIRLLWTTRGRSSDSDDDKSWRKVYAGTLSLQ